MTNSRIPVNRQDDGELLGYVVSDGGSWRAETVFGYVFARSTNRDDIEQTVREQGLRVVQGIWHYLDPDDNEWQPCILSKVAPQQVTVVRTNAMGYQDPSTTKFVVIKHPDETMLIKG